MSKPPTFALSRIRPLGLRGTQFTLLKPETFPKER
jgi:hypothetical protein